MRAFHRYFGPFVLAGALLVAACDSGGSGPEPPEETFDRTAFLAHVANELILPAYEQLEVSADELEQATKAFADDPTEATLAAAQQALKAARLAWQDASLFQFGPAESFALRASINTYPTNIDKIEANVASGEWMLGSLANLDAGGLPALDYLLHGIGASPAETLAKYTTDADAANRSDYLWANGALVASRVNEIRRQWQPAGENYLGQFLSAEKAGVDVGSSLGELINAMILHYERFLRDGKIGIPAGVRSAGVPRPAATEAYYGGYSLELAEANLAAVERLYLGTGLHGAGGVGLDEYLHALDATALSNDIKVAIGEARSALDGLSDPLSEQIERDNAAVVEAFQAMQPLVVLLKADMTSVLGVTITFQDNDGD